MRIIHPHMTHQALHANHRGNIHTVKDRAILWKVVIHIHRLVFMDSGSSFRLLLDVLYTAVPLAAEVLRILLIERSINTQLQEFYFCTHF